MTGTPPFDGVPRRTSIDIGRELHLCLCAEADNSKATIGAEHRDDDGSRAWSIKEAANSIWQCTTAREALAVFNKWYGWAIRSRLAPIKRAARIMKKYLHGILKYTNHPFTNARSEGMNSKIQLIKHRARGYRNRENFRTAIMFHCGGLDMCPR